MVSICRSHKSDKRFLSTQYFPLMIAHSLLSANSLRFVDTNLLWQSTDCASQNKSGGVLKTIFTEVQTFLLVILSFHVKERVSQFEWVGSAELIVLLEGLC